MAYSKTLRRQVFIVVAFFALVTSTPTLSLLWDHIDPYFFLLIDGDWASLDTLYYFVSAAILLDLARQLERPSAWPWPLLLSWLPFVVWSCITIHWSRFPWFSFHEWAYVVLLSPVVFLFSYLLGWRKPISDKGLVAIAAIVFGYLGVRFVLEGDRLRTVGFDVVLSSWWFLTWIPILIVVMGQSDGKRQLIIRFFAILLVQSLALMFPQRLVQLTQVMLFAMFITGSIATKKLDPLQKPVWRYALFILLFYAAFWYFKISSIKPASYLMPDDGSGVGAWASVFLRSERYQIFSYWLSRGIENFWTGVGYGWQIPALSYIRPPDIAKLPDMMFSHGHNFLINTWLQTGMIGLLAIMLPIIALALDAIGTMRRSTSPASSLAAFGVLGMILILLLRNAGDDGMRQGSALIYWFFVGLCLGWSRNGTPFLVRSAMTERPSFGQTLDAKAVIR